MTVRYHLRQRAAWPTYVCGRRGIAQAEPMCQSIPGRGLDHAIGRVLLETVTPLTLEITLTVQQEFQTRLNETDRLHRCAVERARYEADVAVAGTCTSIPRIDWSRTNWKPIGIARCSRSPRRRRATNG